jgi:hypothetical protein
VNIARFSLGADFDGVSNEGAVQGIAQQIFQWELTSSYSTFVVPLPANFWLFGSGLAGLVNITRRRKSHA